MTANSHFVCPPIIPPTDAVKNLEAALRDALAFVNTALVDDINPTMSKRALVQRIETALSALHPFAATPAVDGEPVAYRWKYEDEKSWTFAKKRPDHLYYGKDVICEPLYLAAQPASPLRGRDSVANAIREYCRGLMPAAVQNSHGVERIYYAGLSVYGLTDAILSVSPPEQPAAAPVTGRFGEPVWPGNENDDLDKGDGA